MCVYERVSLYLSVNAAGVCAFVFVCFNCGELPCHNESTTHTRTHTHTLGYD
jgi:hypothetical protein